MATIVYNGTEEVEYLSAESSSPKFEAKVEKLKAGQNAKVVVEPKPPFDQGELAAVIKVKTSCKQQPIVEIPVKLYSPKRIEVTPEAVVLDGAGRMQKYSVVIANNGLEDLYILGVTKSNTRIRAQFSPEADGFSYKLDVTLPMNYVPAPGGDKLTIRTNDKEFGEIVIPIRSDRRLIRPDGFRSFCHLATAGITTGRCFFVGASHRRQSLRVYRRPGTTRNGWLGRCAMQSRRLNSRG